MIASRFQEWVTRVLKVVLVVVMAALAIDIILQVFSRYVIGSSIPWTEELGRYLLIYLTFIGSAVAIYERTHLRVDFLLLKFPVPVRKAIAVGTNVLIIIVAGSLIYFGASFTLLSVGTISPALHQSIAWAYVAMPIAGGLMLVYLIPQLIGQFLNWQNPPQDTTGSAHPIDV